MSTVQSRETANEFEQPNPRRRAALTVRSLIVGLILTCLVDLWIHMAELRVAGGGRGHSALVNTAIPVGPFFAMFVVASINLICRSVLPSLAFTSGELLVIYVMMTTSCVLSSSGQLHFLVPAITAPFHYATTANGWDNLFHRYLTNWIVQKDPAVINGFYMGHTAVPYMKWLPQMGAWIGFILALVFSTYFLCAILRKQWVEREWLTFPTVALPIALTKDKIPIFKNRIFWIGFVVPFIIDILNTVGMNIPGVPQLNLRANYDIGQQLTTPPWNAIGYTPASFYPFVIGIAYLAPTDVSFSSWFFFLITRVERVFGAAAGLQSDANASATQHAAFPFLDYQGAGAFIALTLVSAWMSRQYLIQVCRKAFGKPSELDDSDEPMSYRTAMIGLLIALCAMIGFCSAAGMSPLVAIIVVVVGLIYMIAATRIRAETGSPWLFGPSVDVNVLLTRTFGSQLLGAHDLTVLAMLRPAFANFDYRCMPMPHQMDAYKMANEVGAPKRQIAVAIAVATVIGLTASFCIALTFWHTFGAEVGTEPWRTSMGKVPFDDLANLLRHPISPDIPAVKAMIFGGAFMTALMYCRTMYPWWPLHPFGYALANTGTMSAVWLPFFLAWLFKILALRYGGGAFYKASIPFFLGLVAGDLIGGGLCTLVACFSQISAYPINW